MTVMFNKETEEPAVKKDKKQPKDRFLLGSTGCYFEVANYLSGNSKITVDKVVKLGKNPKMTLENTEGEGRSLKVMLQAPTGETKFNGFVTAGDGKIELDVDEHGEDILEAWQTEEVLRAISADDLIDAWG
jgi:hypothetical protein